MTNEEVQEAWSAAQKSFMESPSIEARDRMMAAYTDFYLMICDGSSIGLDQERARLRQRADDVLGNARLKENAA